MDRGAWRATVHGITKSWTRLSDYLHFQNYYAYLVKEAKQNRIHDV